MDLQSLKIDRGSKQRRTPRRRLPLGLIALLGAAGMTWLLWPAFQPWLDRMRLPTVRTMRVTESAPAAAAAVSGTAANGYIIAARRAALSSDVPGRIVELHVTEGTVLKKGDLVARLYSDELRAALERAKADLAVAEAAVGRAGTSQQSASAAEREAKAATEAAKARLEETRALRRWSQLEFERIDELVQHGISRPQDLDRARSDLDAAEARVVAADANLQAAVAAAATAALGVQVAAGDLAVANAQRVAAEASARQAAATLDKMEVRAPFDGIVVLKDAEVGEVVSPNSQGSSNARGSVCTMVDFDSLEVQADVAETSLAAVQLGGAADVFLDAFPDRHYPGRVDRIWPTADRQKATVEVRIRLLERDDRLRPDMGVRVVFHSDEATAAEASLPATAGRRAILVPESALVEEQGRTGAFLLERDLVRFVEVRVRDRRSGRAAVETGLTSGQVIVLDPPASLRDGDRVLVQEG